LCSGRKHPKVPRQWMDQDGPTDERRFEYVRNGPPYVWRWIHQPVYGSATASTHSTARAATASLCVCGCVQRPVNGSGTLTGWSPIDQGPSGGTAGRRRPRLDRAFRDKKQARTHQPKPTLPARALNARLAAAAGIRSEASRALPREGGPPIPHQPPRPGLPQVRNRHVRWSACEQEHQLHARTGWRLVAGRRDPSNERGISFHTADPRPHVYARRARRCRC
jgi:hypothetical protein